MLLRTLSPYQWAQPPVNSVQVQVADLADDSQEELHQANYFHCNNRSLQKFWGGNTQNLKYGFAVASPFIMHL